MRRPAVGGGGYSVAVRVAGSRPVCYLNLWAKPRRRCNAGQPSGCLDALAARRGYSRVWRSHREHRFSLRLPQRARMAVARPVFDGAAEHGLRRCYRFFLARIGALFVKIRAYKGQTSDPAFARAQLFFNLGNIAIGASRRLRLQLSNLGTERQHFFCPFMWTWENHTAPTRRNGSSKLA